MHHHALPSKAEQKAHMALLGGRTQEAESILLHNGLVFQAIYNNMKLHNWTRYSVLLNILLGVIFFCILQ
ncbi:hypothetical protein NQ314_020869 [Rhamnusium bicolor]|uniref:IFT80/172/WDR35 TPR domain-containing protein n=1 Tax=Rhamnusium bicolor TaxID=1586634 RepID=A0AAV8WKD1_9CUCU|nr:hypothetical protein NQ314_020869 [Rhamnusium bicolor]